MVAGSGVIESGTGTVAGAGHNHQCMLVELSSTSNTTFLNDSVARNMDFVSNSFFERDADQQAFELGGLAIQRIGHDLPATRRRRKRGTGRSTEVW